MKKKIIGLLLLSLCSINLLGCESVEDSVNKNDTISSENRFVDTGDKYVIDELSYKVYFDRNTNIVYLSKNRLFGNSSVGSLCPLYGEDKMPMNLEEYNATK